MGDVTSYDGEFLFAGARMLFSIIIASLLAVVLLGVVFGLTAYDQMNKDKIAEGVTVGGVEVGGMTRSEAATRSPATWRLRAKRAIVGGCTATSASLPAPWVPRPSTGWSTTPCAQP